jgi:hypothetical protein
MKTQKFATIILIAIVILNIIDGDFSNPSYLDYIKMILIAVCFILMMIGGKKNGRN